ncbi:phosphoglycerate dehydrogenase [Mahella australiensis]|uniref:D-3-phosphoglycerate dehydrogenase n=1 Tax=Mahella australiensis (strain DSM 15567 / CIP 107919 / 50-1 BON) TaxID=697281 RepID=F4A0I9_MAHA5|nr:phosphoglycerate dehydrogenase [Mahella australiensis]AEE95868.1 D-3-phosphoglycerate dehydrogenase [Mahella australiensis 50-1 BON]
MRILVPEKIEENGLEILKQKADVDVRLDLTREQLLECIDQYDALIVRSATKVDAELISRGINLKVIGRAGTGVDNIDVDAATERGIIVVNTPDSNNMSAAEHSIALLLALCRNIPQAYMSLKAGKWERSKFKGVELYDKTVAVLGLGRIGSLVASRLKAFGMNVIGYDPYIPQERFDSMGVEKVDSINEIMQRADFITVHLPKTNETMGIISKKEFDMAKKELRIVNCARGGIVDENALYEALKAKRIAGAAIDVFTNEPKEGAAGEGFSHPLLELDNIVFTPHLGASTVEAQRNVGLAIAQQVLNALEGNVVEAVNLHGLNMKAATRLAPYLNLAEKMGRIYYQVESLPAEQIELVYSGDISKEDTRIITLSYLTGLLQPVTDERVNFVNIEKIIHERGIQVIESKNSHVDYFVNLITVNVKNKERMMTFAGTIFGKEEPRIVNFDGFEVDFMPTEHMLMVQNIDRPGIIGQVCTILGDNSINIANMKASRNTKHGINLMVLDVDSDISDEVLAAVKRVDGVLKAKELNL